MFWSKQKEYQLLLNVVAVHLNLMWNLVFTCSYKVKLLKEYGGHFLTNACNVTCDALTIPRMLQYWWMNGKKDSLKRRIYDMLPHLIIWNRDNFTNPYQVFGF